MPAPGTATDYPFEEADAPDMTGGELLARRLATLSSHHQRTTLQSRRGAPTVAVRTHRAARLAAAKASVDDGIRPVRLGRFAQVGVAPRGDRRLAQPAAFPPRATPLPSPLLPRWQAAPRGRGNTHRLVIALVGGGFLLVGVVTATAVCQRGHSKSAGGSVQPRLGGLALPPSPGGHAVAGTDRAVEAPAKPPVAASQSAAAASVKQALDQAVRGVVPADAAADGDPAEGDSVVADGTTAEEQAYAQDRSAALQAAGTSGWGRVTGGAATEGNGWNRSAPDLPDSVYAGKLPAAPAGALALWPARGPLTSLFGPSHPLGIDIGLTTGTPIRAMAAGRVTFSGGDPCCSYGYHVDIDHGNGVMTRYGHLVRPSGLRAGQSVSIGDVIGLAGSTGYSTGPHLHFEVRFRGVPVNPLLVLP